MKIVIDKAFLKDINKVKDKFLLENLNNIISGLEIAAIWYHENSR